jgi:hypothetical protein
VECAKCGAREAVWCLTDSPTPNSKRLPLHEERWAAAGKYGSVGWHTFRHTYRSWLDDTGAPVGAAEADAACPDLNHDECLRNAFDGRQTGGEQQGRQKSTAERIAHENPANTPDQPYGVFAGAVIWGYLGLANRLNGCGGRI